MKYFPLVWAALWRKRPRTILTMLSIMVAFLLYAMLGAVNHAFNVGVDLAGADRLVTTGKYSITQILPASYEQQIRSIPGVADVAASSWFGGVYQEEKNFFPQFPVEAASYLNIYPELVLPAEQKQAFLDTKTGAIIAKTLADRFHFKVGDKIPLIGAIWPLKDGSSNWSFDLVGIFDTADPAQRGQFEMMLFRHDYFDEAKQWAQGTVGWYITKISNPAQSAQIAKQIDALFANSPNETRTDSEKAFNQSFAKQMGDIGLIIGSILGAVFFTLLILTGNTMMQSVRERIPELAVLKTLGFTDAGVLTLVLAESLLMCLLGAGIGITLAAVILPGLADHMPGFAGMAVSPAAIAGSVGIAILLALVVGAVPAARAMRLNIVDALRA